MPDWPHNGTIFILHGYGFPLIYYLMLNLPVKRIICSSTLTYSSIGNVLQTVFIVSKSGLTRTNLSLLSGDISSLLTKWRQLLIAKNRSLVMLSTNNGSLYFSCQYIYLRGNFRDPIENCRPRYVFISCGVACLDFRLFWTAYKLVIFVTVSMK